MEWMIKLNLFCSFSNMIKLFLVSSFSQKVLLAVFKVWWSNFDRWICVSVKMMEECLEWSLIPEGHVFHSESFTFFNNTQLFYLLLSLSLELSYIPRNMFSHTLAYKGTGTITVQGIACNGNSKLLAGLVHSTVTAVVVGGWRMHAT